MNTVLRTVGLFAGIGGIELGLAKAGHETKLLCEVDSAAAAVLRNRFPDIALHDDVTTLKALPTGIDLLAAGFPCQDLSQAGNTAGIDGARSGLVGEVFRLLKRQRVPLVLIENVPFMLQLNKGHAMEVVVSNLEQLGYKWAYRIVNSRAFGVPQRRERVYLLASLDKDPRDILLSGEAVAAEYSGNWREWACGFYWTEGIRGLGWAVDSIPTLKGGSTIGIPSQPAIILPDGRVGKPDIRDAERLQGFEENWTKPAEMVAKKGVRWKLAGNAVTVSAAAWIGSKLRKPVAYNDGLDSLLARKTAWPRAAWNVGSGRYVSDASAFPIREKCPSLARFLRYPLEPLSVKATRGFLERTKISSLRFPPGFIDVLEEHLRAVEMAAAA
ncbi:MAG TPA: DNA (cytosine-5-)-methyltransferase [Chthoniobacter sp.]